GDRRWYGDAFAHAAATTDAALRLEHRTTVLVERQGPLADRAHGGTHAARLALKRNAPLEVELDPAEPNFLPAGGGEIERVGGAGTRAGHLGARQARHPGGLQVRRPRRQSAARTHLQDHPGRARTHAFTAARARRQECHFRQRPRWPHVALLHHAILGGTGDPLDGVAEDAAEERPAVFGRVGHGGKVTTDSLALRGEIRSTIYDLRFTIYDGRFTIYDLRFTICD